ncbi:MAG: hypothetical protein GWP07_07045 [Xanthomonadaceae bacterium]|nr:hypothetical protein [Xanthomonadaceae bacterium]
MDRSFYRQFMDSCQKDQENFANLKTLVETTLDTPIEIQITKVEEEPVITARLQQRGKIRHAAGGFSTIPAYFDDGRLRLMPLFLYETATIDPRFLAYENSHIQQFLDKKGEYANYKEFFLNAPDAGSPEEKKLAYLRHVAKRVLINEQDAFPLLHPGKEKKTLHSLIVYQLAERISWYIETLEMDRENVISKLSVTLEGMMKHDPYYADFNLVELFKQTMISLTMFG